MGDQITGPAAGPLTEVGIQARALPLAEAFQDRLPLARELRDIQDHFGVEVAQCAFALILEKLPRYSSLIRRIRSKDLRDLASEPSRTLASKFEVTIVASQLPGTGRKWGDHVDAWREWARSLGFKTDEIRTRPENDLWQNAEVISSHLLSNPHPNRILITYGQGALELRSLLTRRLGARVAGPALAPGTAAGELDSIKLWINVAGAYSGASIVEYWKRSLFSRILMRFNLANESRPSRLANQIDSRLTAFKNAPTFPSQMTVMNLVAMPLRHQVPLSLAGSYAFLSERSPTDGMVDLYSSIASPGFIVPVQGMSHLAESIRLEPMLKRALAVFLEDQAETSVGKNSSLERVSTPL